ncbi:MAG: CvpA family protein [Acutalibacteraceae bacterium]
MANGLAACGAGSAEEIAAHLGGVVGTTADAVADALVNNVFRPVGVLLIRMVSFLLLFIVLMIIAHFLANLISKVFRLPLLRQADGLLGALLGAVEGVILGLVAVTVMQMMAASTTENALISQQDIESTVLVSAVAQINPVTGTLESVLENVR